MIYLLFDICYLIFAIWNRWNYDYEKTASNNKSQTGDKPTFLTSILFEYVPIERKTHHSPASQN